MKKCIAILLALTLLLLVSCFEALPTVDYNCTADVYFENTDARTLRVYYPVILGHENSAALNEALRDAALSYMENYLTYNAPEGFYTYEIGTVQATLQLPDVVSFLCCGSIYAEGAAHPASIVYTLNVDLRDGSFLTFDDMVADFPALAEKFKNGKFSYVSGIDNITEQISYADMIGQYDALYGIYPPAFLYADGSDVMLAFSFELIYALGGHAEFAIDADEVKKSLGPKLTEILYSGEK